MLRNFEDFLESGKNANETTQIEEILKKNAQNLALEVQFSKKYRQFSNNF